MTKLLAKSKDLPKAKPMVDHLPVLKLDELPQTTLMTVLGQAVSMRRSHGSKTEARFVAWLANRLPVHMIDEHGNIHVDLRKDNTHRTLFTAHTDTVHAGGGVNTVRVDGAFWRANGDECLGADDGAGVALLCHLIHHSVPAYYVFFRGEERGGIGSSGLAETCPKLLKKFDRAIAFDRAGYHDVITHQGASQCCSNEFAEALCKALTPDDFSMAYMPCDSGVYTDTAEFVELIPECTNVSVGYKNQHGGFEEQDIVFLQMLANQIIQIDWDALPTQRDPSIAVWNKFNSFKSTTFGYEHTHTLDTFDYYSRSYAKAYSFEDEVIDALEAYIDYSDVTTLFEMIAEYVSPDDPHLAHNMMIRNRLTEDVARDALNAIKDSADPDAVLHDLFNECCIN